MISWRRTVATDAQLVPQKSHTGAFFICINWLLGSATFTRMKWHITPTDDLQAFAILRVMSHFAARAPLEAVKQCGGGR